MKLCAASKYLLAWINTTYWFDQLKNTAKFTRACMEQNTSLEITQTEMMTTYLNFKFFITLK